MFHMKQFSGHADYFFVRCVKKGKVFEMQLLLTNCRLPLTR